MPALAIMSMGTGYSAVLLPDGQGGSAGVTGGSMFDKLARVTGVLKESECAESLNSRM